MRKRQDCVCWFGSTLPTWKCTHGQCIRSCKRSKRDHFNKIQKINNTTLNKIFCKSSSNARSCERTVEFGWWWWFGDRFAQVRQPNGGGARHVRKKKPVQWQQYGKWAHNFFSWKKLYMDYLSMYKGKETWMVTVEELYEQLKLKIIRIYILNKENKNNDTSLTSCFLCHLL